VDTPATGVASARPRRARWGWLRRLVVLVLGLYLLWSAGLFFFQNKLIYPGTGLARATKEAFEPRAGEIDALVGKSGKLRVFLLPPKGWTPDAPPAPVVVYFHGNYELAQYGTRSKDTGHFRRSGFWVAIPEYRGYDGVPGPPGERGILDDMVEVIDWIKGHQGVDASRVVYYGRSLGGGVALGTALARPPSAVILRSTFTSIPDLAYRFAVPGFLVRSRFENRKALAALNLPVLIAHAKDDEIIPFSHAGVLLKAARHGESYLTEGSHDVYADEGEFRARMVEFLERAWQK